jgi:hypothetical protein
MLLVWLTDHHVPESNVYFIAWDAASDFYHQTKLDPCEIRLYLDGDRSGSVISRLACREACDDDVMFANTAERIQVGVIGVIVR